MTRSLCSNSWQEHGAPKRFLCSINKTLVGMWQSNEDGKYNFARLDFALAFPYHAQCCGKLLSLHFLFSFSFYTSFSIFHKCLVFTFPFRITFGWNSQMMRDFIWKKKQKKQNITMKCHDVGSDSATWCKRWTVPVSEVAAAWMLDVSVLWCMMSHDALLTQFSDSVFAQLQLQWLPRTHEAAVGLENKAEIHQRGWSWVQ